MILNVTEFAETTQSSRHYAVQGPSRLSVLILQSRIHVKLPIVVNTSHLAPYYWSNFCFW